MSIAVSLYYSVRMMILGPVLFPINRDTYQLQFIALLQALCSQSYAEQNKIDHQEKNLRGHLFNDTVDGSETRRSPPGMYKTLVKSLDIYYQPQLVSRISRFLNHQQYVLLSKFIPKNWDDFLRISRGVDLPKFCWGKEHWKTPWWCSLSIPRTSVFKWFLFFLFENAKGIIPDRSL